MNSIGIATMSIFAISATILFAYAVATAVCQDDDLRGSSATGRRRGERDRDRAQKE